MNIIRIDHNNMVNGNGLRTVIWCAGCTHHCKGCQNPETWSPDTGRELGDWVYDELRNQLDRKEIRGVTFSGGEATFPASRDEATALMKWIKTNYPDKDIWVYTGFHYEEIKNLEMMKYIDVLVDGPYMEDLNPGPQKLKWRGSFNQRVIDVPATRKEGRIVWLKDFNGKPIYENEKDGEGVPFTEKYACRF